MTATIALPRQPHSDWLARLRTIMVLRPGQRVAHVPGIGVSTSRRAVSAGGVDWSTWFDYVWIAKGATSLAVSYVDLVAGVSLGLLGVAPAFGPDGWTFTSTGDVTQLNTTITSDNSLSMMIRIGSSTQQNAACGGETSTVGNATRLNIYPIYPSYAGPRSYFRSGGNYDQATVYVDGAVLAVTPAKAYANGSPLGNVTDAWTGSTTQKITIGGQYIDGSLAERWAGTVQAFGLKLGTLSDSQIAAVSTEMAAL